MEFLRQWILTLVASVFVLTLVHVLLPEGSIKKYASLATGLVMMLAIFSPLAQLSRMDIRGTEVIPKSRAVKVDAAKCAEKLVLGLVTSVPGFEVVGVRVEMDEMSGRPRSVVITGAAASEADMEKVRQNIALQLGIGWDEVVIR